MQALSLESFDAPDENDTATLAAYDDGFRAGLAHGQAEAAENQKTLQAGLIQAISDLQFTYVEARAEFIVSLEPLLTAIPDIILHTCVDAAYTLQIAQLISDAAQASDPGKMTLTVHPSAYDAVVSAVSNSALDVAVDQDPTLSPHAVWVGRASGEMLIDFDAVSAQVTEILSAITETNEKRESNG